MRSRFLSGAMRPVWIAGAVVLLALYETAVALIAPSLAPTDADWAAAALAVRADFRAGDLIVAAPAWADPILRVHLGDLIPAEVAGRLDDARFGRVWEVGQRGAHAPEAAAGAVAFERRFGRLTVRRVERPAERVDYDFVAHWSDARVSRIGVGGTVACATVGDRIQCPGFNYNYVRRQIVEVDTRLREALLAQPVGNSTVVIEYPAVRLGQTLVVATGLHDVWMRKAARGTVEMRVIVGGQAQTLPTTDDDSGWTRTRIDTAARAGQTVPVRFEITSPAPYARHFAFAAEARG
ncbi:MAG TPA: hypothetical protein VFG23_17505 [Polyangia bacterium]|nr:hypothetical protein [Polyangia bacterium]